MRADRLLSILLLLQTHGRLSARQLSERLEVSERTVHRDMESLAQAGVPVWAQTGRHGGWELAEDYRTDLTGLDEAELRSLVAAGASRQLAALGLGEALDRALTKVLAALPATRREAAIAARSYLHIDPTGWRRAEEAAPWLPTLESALRAGRRIAMRYERADGQESERTVDPLGLVAKGSSWYLVATSGGDPRTYRASRVRHVTILDEPADRPADLDLAAVWTASRRDFEARLPSIHWTMRCSAAAMERVRYGWRYGSVVHAGEPDGDGWTTVECRADAEWVAVEAVLGLGGEASVVEPASIADRVAATARAVLARAAAGGA